MVLHAWLRHESQSFIHILWVYLQVSSLLTSNLFLFCNVRFWPSSLSLCCSLQTTTSCCSARPCSGRCLRRRTGRRCDCWLETTLRSAAVWILVPSTSSYLSITSFTAGQKQQPGLFYLHFLYISDLSCSKCRLEFYALKYESFNWCLIYFLKRDSRSKS